MIEKIREEMSRKLEETACSHYENYYYDLFRWSLLLSNDDREKHIKAVSGNDWCAELAVNNYDLGKLSLMKAYVLLLLHHHIDAAKSMLPALKAFDIIGGVSSEKFIDIAKSNLRVSDGFKKEVYSEHNSKNASGPRNECHDEAIKIMMDTWREYPLASKNRMKLKIIEYFGKDRSGKDKISESSIKRWIKLNDLGPKKEVRPPIDFHLVIRS